LKHKEDRLNECKIDVANFEKKIDIEQNALLESRQNLQTARYHDIFSGYDTSNGLFPSMKSQDSMFQDINKTANRFEPRLKSDKKFMIPSLNFHGSVNNTLAGSTFDTPFAAATSTA